MSFLDELYNKNNAVSESTWMKVVYEMEGEIKNTVSREHSKGNRHFNGYFYWFDNDCYLNKADEKAKIGGQLGNEFPIEKMSKKLSERLKLLGFTNYSVYFDDAIP